MPPSTELILPDGARVKVDARGILVGRTPTAEVLLTDPSSSRRHALLYTDSCGLQLVPLGRVPVRVNGEATQEQRLILDGDLLGFPGLELRVGQGGAPEGRRSGWLLQLSPARGASLEEARSLPIELPCTAGGGPEDLLPLPRWPSIAVILEPGFPAGWRARLARGISLNGRAVGPDRSVPLSSGDRLGYDGDIVRVLDASRAMQTTLDDDAADLPWKVELAPIPSGAVILSHASKTEICLEVDFPMADSFTWAEKQGTDYVDGTYDLAMDMAATETPESLPICGLFLADHCMEGAPTARPWPPGPMPDSTTLYCADDSETLDPCPIPGDPTWGQDGNYLVNTPSWVLGADTVLDQVTGLLWERGHSPETQDWWGSLDYCAELVLDGREDWTLPSRNELLSILDLGTYNPTIDAEAFPDTPATFFWSSSPLPYSALAYGVRFEQGYMYDHDPASSGYACCVTQTTPSEGTRWELADETATDLRTGLVWQRNITSDALSWSGALQACESLVLSGASDWRLPTQKEQETIIDETRWGPSADRVAFPGQPPEWFWNSTPAADAPGYSWAASFTNGYMTPAANGERYRVQCMR